MGHPVEEKEGKEISKWRNASIWAPIVALSPSQVGFLFLRHRHSARAFNQKLAAVQDSECPSDAAMERGSEAPFTFELRGLIKNDAAADTVQGYAYILQN